MIDYWLSIICVDLISEKRNMKAGLMQERLESGCLTVYIYKLLS